MFVSSNCTSSNSKISHECIGSNDTLYITYHGNAELVQFKMYQGVDFVLSKKADSLFEGKQYIKNLDDAIFTYDVIVYKFDSLGNYLNIKYKNKNFGDDLFIWKGKNRKTSFFKPKNIKGKLYEKEINSKYLGENRSITVYYPPEHNNLTPIFYIADGQLVKNFSYYIDTLISDKIIHPLILVGVHSSKNYRHKEYVYCETDNIYFIKHKEFFLDEVVKSIETNFLNWSGERYIFGVSNGGAFCMYMGLNYPDLFEEVISFSTADYISEFCRPIEFKFDHYPKFYMGAGKFEESIYNDNIKFSTKMKSENVEVKFKSFISGHDHNVWRYEFLEYLLKELPAK